MIWSLDFKWVVWLLPRILVKGRERSGLETGSKYTIIAEPAQAQWTEQCFSVLVPRFLGLSLPRRNWKQCTIVWMLSPCTLTLFAGTLWNLSSYEPLKIVIINHGLQTLTNEVIIPHSGWENEPNEDSKPRDAEWTTVFKNTSGCLRWTCCFYFALLWGLFCSVLWQSQWDRVLFLN